MSTKLTPPVEVNVGEIDELVSCIANEIECLILERASQGRNLVLGLATGSTPIPLYAELVRRHQEEGLSFQNVVTFNLDEYEGLSPEHSNSYHNFMQEHLFNQVDIQSKNTFLPPGTYENSFEEALLYEEKIKACGGIDLQILGIGRDGHIGFNEPGSDNYTHTRRVTLANMTRQDAASVFEGIQNVPTHAMTMGISTILKARRIILMAWGHKKREIVAEAMGGNVSPTVPATFLQDHCNTAWYLDRAAASN